MVCIGPSDWINQHIGPHSCAHALSCDDIKHSNTKAIVSYLREGPRMASLIWAKLCVNGTTYNESNQDIDELLVSSYIYEESIKNNICLNFELFLVSTKGFLKNY